MLNQHLNTLLIGNHLKLLSTSVHADKIESPAYYLAKEGDTVLDAYSGPGTTAAAMQINAIPVILSQSVTFFSKLFSSHAFYMDYRPIYSCMRNWVGIVQFKQRDFKITSFRKQQTLEEQFTLCRPCIEKAHQLWS